MFNITSRRKELVNRRNFKSLLYLSYFTEAGIQTYNSTKCIEQINPFQIKFAVGETKLRFNCNHKTSFIYNHNYKFSYSQFMLSTSGGNTLLPSDCQLTGHILPIAVLMGRLLSSSLYFRLKWPTLARGLGALYLTLSSSKADGLSHDLGDLEVVGKWGFWSNGNPTWVWGFLTPTPGSPDTKSCKSRYRCPGSPDT